MDNTTSSLPPLPQTRIMMAAAFLATSLLFSAGCSGRAREEQHPIDTMFHKDGELTFTSADGKVLATIDIEIADDQEKRTAGLMGRPSLGDHNGMLFVFDTVQPLSFWMMNTMIPLDMMFVDGQKQIITVHRNTTPYTTDSYSATSDGQYVVEVNGGFCDRYGIDVGASISWKRMPK